MNKQNSFGSNAWLNCLAAFLAAALATCAAQPQSEAPQGAPSVTLDRVVAVVNHQAILASDLTEELQLSILDPGRPRQGAPTPQRALQQLISRALIEQQIREQDLTSAETMPEQVAARLAQIRKELPACVHENCATDAGWAAFLASHGLTPERVETYLRNRIEILHFIELRFRQGIRISPEETETYYRETLVPQYAAGEAIPPLQDVAPRIQEILLQQQVNVLFEGWLDNLRKQGEIEVLDPALESADRPVTGPGPDSTPVKQGAGAY
jgi:peptidyl-prolyl cis-trans isomerase SurA